MTRPPLIQAYILSAGRGRRLGGICKGRLLFNGQPLVVRQARAMLGAGVARVNIVVGHEAASVREAFGGVMADDLRDTGLEQVAFLEVSEGEGDATADPDIQISVRCGLLNAKAWLAMHPDALGILISLVDLPLLTEDDILHLIDVAQKQDASVVIPESPDRQPGHPIWLSQRAVMALSAEENGFSLREILHHNSSSDGIGVHHMHSNRCGYFYDLDTFDDIEKFHREFGAAVSFPTEHKS